MTLLKLLGKEALQHRKEYRNALEKELIKQGKNPQDFKRWNNRILEIEVLEKYKK